MQPGAHRRRADGRDARDPRERRAHRDRDESSGEAALEADVAEVREEHDGERREPDDRTRERAEEEAERDERERDPGQRGKERRARRRLPDALGERRADELDHARAETRDEPGLPRDAYGIGRAGGLGYELRGQHDQEDVAEER